MTNPNSEAATLANGVKMPWVGLGTWAQGPTVTATIKSALQIGYRSIDTGSFYQNEEGIGLGIKESGISRQTLFVTTKVWNSEQGYEATLKSFDVSLQHLQLDYADLYLVHWPVRGKFKDTWKALEKLYQDGRVRAIGVSNFNIHHLKEVMKEASIKPMVNQFDIHPLNTWVELRKYCQEEGIQVEAWAPLGQGAVFQNPVLQEIAAAHGKSVSQVVLRWHLQNGVVTIPKSNSEDRLKENLRIFDFQLSADDLRKIDALNENRNLLGFDADEIPSVLLAPPATPWPYSLE
jgi:diketogulonate reductase-like aldo/keto reductase